MLVIITVTFFSFFEGQAAEQTPENFVREFYNWYFQADKGQNRAEYNDDIYKYVSTTTVNIAKSMHGEINYFTQKNISLPDDVKIIVHTAITLDAVNVVPVSFHTNTVDHVIVFLNKKNGQYRIIRVTDIYPFF